MSLLFPKIAAPAYDMAGRLYKSNSGFVLLSVPNALVRGVFDALDEPGIELPLYEGQLNAHATVMYPEELEAVGGADAISERGHTFTYQLGPLRAEKPRDPNFSKVWYLVVKSPELRELRRSYGLPAQPRDGWDFHITVARRKTNVLRTNETSKAKAADFATAMPLHAAWRG